VEEHLLVLPGMPVAFRTSDEFAMLFRAAAAQPDCGRGVVGIRGGIVVRQADGWSGGVLAPCFRRKSVPYSQCSCNRLMQSLRGPGGGTDRRGRPRYGFDVVQGPE